MSTRLSQTLLLGCTLVAATTAFSAERATWELCPPVELFDAVPLPLVEDPEAIYLNADRAETGGKGDNLLEGNVEARHGEMLLRADSARFDRTSQQLELSGEVDYQRGSTRVFGQRALISLQQQSGEMEQIRFFFGDFHAYGEAGHITLDREQGHRLDEVRYTTCPPQDPDWLLSADRLELNETENLGEAYGVALRFQGVPFLYLPYLNFPLQGRKSGLLAPTVGSGSDGADISMPVYWNIAPNQDATFTPRYIEERGGLLAGEYRYLLRSGEGQLNAETLPGDELYGEDRYAIRFEHESTISGNWRATAHYAEVSDGTYFDDLGSGQTLSSTTHLERSAAVGYRSRNLSLNLMAQSWQTLSGSQPYRRVPQLTLGYAPAAADSGLRWGLDGEWVRFDHDAAVTTGDRADIEPYLSWPLSRSWGYIEPRLVWRYTAYALENGTGDNNPDRSVPITSIDSGLVFERPLQLGGRALRQTLEPRLYYLSVPYRDQSGLPLFDSAEYQLNFDQLFSAERFSGGDRVGDTEQLTIGLSSSLFDEQSGSEYLRAALGQILYLEDRKVALSGNSLDQSDRSNLVAELETRPNNRLHARIGWQWDSEQSHSAEENLRLRYAKDAERQISIGLRQRRDIGLRQSDITALWPVTPQWQLVGRWHYDLRAEATLESVAGFEYRSCCWVARLFGRAHRTSVSSDLDHSLYLTLELKGLTTLGKSLSDELEQGLLINE